MHSSSGYHTTCFVVELTSGSRSKYLKRICVCACVTTHVICKKLCWFLIKGTQIHKKKTFFGFNFGPRIHRNTYLLGRCTIVSSRQIFLLFTLFFVYFLNPHTLKCSCVQCILRK